MFDVDESPLYWKQMPGRTFIQNEAKSVPGFKASKDRITVMLGHKLKPSVIWHSQNPKDSKHINTFAASNLNTQG
jgi:hypothetical protein